MFDLTILDYIYIVLILGSTIWATVRGGVYETIATMSWVVAAVAARFASPWLDKLLQGWFKLSESTVGTLVASYFIVFFVILILTSFINQKLREKIQHSILNITDKTLGVIFGIVRGVAVMGLLYWAMLWYYSDTPTLPAWLENARTRPIMQMTAIKINDWFISNKENKLLQRDVAGTKEAIKIYQNLINPAVKDEKSGSETDDDTGYKESERNALENQLLQIETSAAAQEAFDAEREAQENQQPAE